MTEFEEWFKQSSEKIKKKVSEEYQNLKIKYNQLTDKASRAKFEDDLAGNFYEELFVKAVLSGDLKFTFAGKKAVRSFFDNYEKSIWKTEFDCFEFVLHHTKDGDLMEFKINHSRYMMANLFRINNVVRHGVDKTDTEPNIKIMR